MANQQQASNSPRKTLGVARYRAARSGQNVILFATGDTPTPNYKVWFQAAQEPGKPPVYELWWMAPSGFQIQVLTPFSVHSVIHPSSSATEVVVRDANGLHNIKIESGDATTPGEPPLVPLPRHEANQFDFRYRGQPVSFTQANIAGDPLLTVGNRHFYGREIMLQDSPIGQLVTVVMQAVADGDSSLFSLLLPPTLVEGYGVAEIEAVVLETISRTTIAGPPLGAGVLYEKVEKIKGQATFIIS